MIETTNKKQGRSVDAKGIIVKNANTITVRESIVSIFPGRPKDATQAQTLKLIEQSGTLDFWLDNEEDIYSHSDGEEI